MNIYSDDKFTRVSKRAAIKLLESGKQIAVCPVKLRPGFPWAPECYVDKARLESEDTTLQSFLNSVSFYNCTYETGYYLAFYQVTG